MLILNLDISEGMHNRTGLIAAELYSNVNKAKYSNWGKTGRELFLVSMIPRSV